MRKDMSGVNMKPSIINELEILNILDHPNIANFNECYEDDTFFHAILEFSPGECLAQIFLDCTEMMDIFDILKIFYQICKTAAYLRKEQIIHRDYKPANIMVYKTQNCKSLGYQIQLLDFGLARKFAASINDKEIMGSPHYVAPESLGQKYSFCGDVWSIGVMLYFAVALQHPFEDDDPKELFRKIKEDQLEFEPKEAWKNIPQNLKDLIESMLQKEPKNRINIDRIPIHSAFKEIHAIEDAIYLSSSENRKLYRYYTLLDPIQRKFMKYSTKFIPHKIKTTYCEKFALLDKDNYGYINFTPDDAYDN
jgi:serine/threonine protein kinase